MLAKTPKGNNNNNNKIINKVDSTSVYGYLCTSIDTLIGKLTSYPLDNLTPLI